MHKRTLLLAFCSAALIGGAASLLYLQHSEDTTAAAYGFIDVRESVLSFEMSGRIEKLLVDEGAKVEAGQPVALLDTAVLRFELKEAQAQCEALRAQLNKLQGGYRPEVIAAAQAESKRLDAAAALADLSAQRAEELYKKRSLSAQERDDARYSARQAEAASKAAAAQLEQYQNGYEAADIAAKAAELTAAEAQRDRLKYALTEQSVLKAPTDGVIRSRLQDAGDMTGPQSAVFYLARTAVKKARFYVSELRLTGVKVGQEVTVTNTGGAALQARITAISPTAMFTPKTVQTEELRPDLQYEVQAEFADPDELFRLGQAVTVDLHGSAAEP